MSKIGIVIEREYLERVKKKSFIFTTLLMPVLMLALMAMPALIMNYVDSSVTSVLVIDNNGLIAPKLTDTPEIRFTDNSSLTIDSALTRTDVDAVLVIPHNIISSRRSSLQLFSNGPSSYTAENAITSQINKIVENERLKQHNIADLDSILADVNSSVAISTVRNDRDSEDCEILSSGVSYGIGIGMSFVLYMFLLIYGQMVMTSIIEEKSNRVLEVVVSSVKPMQLMMGKIIGVALVAVTQMILWGILLVIMSAWVLPAIIPAESMADITALRAGNLEAVSTTGSIDMINVLASLTQVRQHTRAYRDDDSIPRARVPHLLIYFCRHRISSRQHPGRIPDDIICGIPHNLRTHFRPYSCSRPHGKHRILGIAVPTHRPYGDGSAHPLRHPRMGDMAVTLTAAPELHCHGMDSRKDLPHRHIHVRKETIPQGNNPMDFL